ncbi:MAG: SIS domain-containing protein [Clostridia bacterium]|jgi:D-arabinose 5-phosphate isomerase GutQ|nr:SIS domain-containing protein [Clostridia bacterium]MDD4544050.1 SIS domain-containing protein [Clostridia bacterium]HXK72712.1 SIS domain-containing protein [Clostridia bacterium]
MRSEILEAARKSLNIEKKEIERLISYLNEDSLLEAVEKLANCKSIMTVASGSSGIAAKKFAHSLCCIERHAMFMSPSEAVHGGLGALDSDDVMVMVSRGGKTVELLPIISVCNKKKATLIAVTENEESILARSSDIVLKLNIDKESDPLGLMATSSFVATIALFDSILAALIVKTGFTSEQFGIIHPGGAVGELLNKK